MTAISNGQPDTELLESHQAVLDAVASVDTDDPDHPLEDFGLGTPPNTDIGLRGQGINRLAVALHSYADSCLCGRASRRGDSLTGGSPARAAAAPTGGYASQLRQGSPEVTKLAGHAMPNVVADPG